MFLRNKYTRIYFDIIHNAKNNPVLKGERHHILPRSMGGEDDNDNLILLSTRQHFLCHKLLIKMTCGLDRSKMIRAFTFMCFTKNNKCLKDRVEAVSSHDYELARRLCKEIIYTEERNRKISVARKGKTQIRTEETKNKHKETLRKKREDGIGLSDYHKKQIAKGLIGNKNGAGCVITTEHRQKIAETNSKSFMITDPEGMVEIVKNLSVWLRDRKITTFFPRTRDKKISRGVLKNFILSEIVTY